MGNTVEVVRCTEESCAKLFRVSYDEGYTVYCEDCGEHSASKCPHCGELVDLVYHDSFYVDEDTV